MKLLQSVVGRTRLATLISLLAIAAVVTATACLMLVVHLQLSAYTERKAIEAHAQSLLIGGREQRHRCSRHADILSR